MAQRLKRLPPMQETWVRFLGWEDPLEKETAAHSSVLAWRIPGTEEPGGLQSTGSQTWTRLSDFASLWFLLAASRGEAGKSWPARREPSPGTGLWLVGQGGAGSVGDVDGWGGEGEEEHR